MGKKLKLFEEQKATTRTAGSLGKSNIKRFFKERRRFSLNLSRIIIGISCAVGVGMRRKKMESKGAKTLDVNSQSRIAGSSAEEREKIVIFIVQKVQAKCNRP